MDRDGFLLVGVVEREDAQDRPAIVRVVVGDPVHDSPDGFFNYSSLFHY